MTKLKCTIVFVSDMGRSVAFYRDVLGLPLKVELPGWSEFASEGSTLVLAKSWLFADEMRRERPGVAQLGFDVEDLDALHVSLIQKGVTCLRPPTSTEFGITSATYLDPDGLSFTLSEPYAHGAAKSVAVPGPANRSTL